MMQLVLDDPGLARAYPFEVDEGDFAAVHAHAQHVYTTDPFSPGVPTINADLVCWISGMSDVQFVLARAEAID